MKNLVIDLVLACIRFYQKAISPIMGPKCRFIPTCSQYTYEAIQIHGFIKGSFLGVKRILKCHPLNHSDMYDPVPPRKENINK